MAEPIYEEYGTPVESWSWERGWTATRRIRCSHANRVTALSELVQVPYPYISGITLYVLSATLEPAPGQQTQGAYTDVALYDDALIRLEYGVPEAGQPPEGVEYATESIQVAGEYATIDPSDLYWSDTTALKKEEAPGKLMKTVEYQYNRMGVTYVSPAILSLVGCVNDRPISPTTPGLNQWTFETETLLYTPPQMSRRFTSAGASLWDMQFRFIYRPNFDKSTGIARGWNWFYRASSDNYQQIYSPAPGQAGSKVIKVYPLGNFLQITV